MTAEYELARGGGAFAGGSGLACLFAFGVGVDGVAAAAAAAAAAACCLLARAAILLSSRSLRRFSSSVSWPEFEAAFGFTF